MGEDDVCFFSGKLESFATTSLCIIFRYYDPKGFRSVRVLTRAGTHARSSDGNPTGPVDLVVF